MGKKLELLKDKETAKVEAVLELIRKQTPLTVKQEKFCNYACVKRFLKVKGDNVKKAAKQLRACLSWRESIVTDQLIADDFSAELSEGLAYVAGHDDESRPVLIFRMKQDYQKLHSQKLFFTRLLAFTMEVAISSMPKNVEQFVMLFDASFYRSASGFMNLLLGALKIVGEYYPGRLSKTFVIDPPSLFAYLWKKKKRYIQMAPRSDNISEISPVKESWSIVVRIVRAWFVRDVNRDAHPFSLDMVLMDASGNKIHATVRRTLIYKFEKDLQEGKVYSMSGFGVAANIGSYRTTKHEYKLNFQFNTKVKLCGKNGVPSDIYPISNPIDVFNSEYDTDYLVDVMGMLTGVGTQREYERNGTKTKMVAMELDYDGFKFKVTLFGQYAEELNAFVAAGETDNVVVVVLLAKVKIWQGAATVQNTIYSTKLIFNPDLIAAHDLKKRMVGKNSVPSPGIAILQDPSRITEEDDFLKITPRKTVEDLKECTMESCFVVKATVKFVIDTDEWWYTACVCNKKVVPDEKMYFCSKCNKHVMHVCPRYMIKVRVIDETDSATFVIFDRDAALLLKKTAADMIESMGSDESETLPKEISSLVESTFLFKVETNISTDARFEKSYRVRRISNDVELLKKFTGVPTEATVVEGSFEAVENAENDSSVNQNLLKKLGDSEVVGTKDVDAKKAVDLTSDEVDVAPAKRSCPFEGEGSGGNGPVKLLKNIKVEKD